MKRRSCVRISNYRKLLSKASTMSFFSITLTLLLLLSVTEECVDAKFIEEGICPTTYVRNSAQNIEAKLKGCRVIEGSLQISLITNYTSDVYESLTLPELREITGYLLVFDVPGLTTLRNLFPNLTVIRGQELLHDHALLIQQARDLQEVGLISLTVIERGKIWISNNEKLCYVQTVDWSRILNRTFEAGELERLIRNNKRSDLCPDQCARNCPTSKFDNRRLCWSSSQNSCQIVYERNCDSSGCNSTFCRSSDRKECKMCDEHCYGGCSGGGLHSCYACKNVRFKNKCLDRCPRGYYEYLNRRCVTEEECLSSKYKAPMTIDKIYGKLHNDSEGSGSCVIDCPKNTELASDGKECVACNERCNKACEGGVIDSIENARVYRGCTKIAGSLKIQIRAKGGGSGMLANELRESLDKIEEIEDYLIISYTYSILSLTFFENLKTIRGKQLYEDSFALVVKSNENLMELWNDTQISNNVRRIEILNRSARVLFHYNPKLCPNKILEFVSQAGISIPAGGNDIGVTNGDKIRCNSAKLDTQILSKHSTSVMIRWHNYRRDLLYSSYLLNYEVYYKEAPEYPHKNVSIYDDRDPCSEDGWFILDVPKMSDEEVNLLNNGNSINPREREPLWENEKNITNLKPFTYYVFYVKTNVIQTEGNFSTGNYSKFGNGAQSDLIYFQTLPSIPEKPRNLRINHISGKPNTLSLSWVSPTRHNGNLSEYRIWVKQGKEDQSLHDQRNICENGRAQSKSVKSSEATTMSPFLTQNGQECCACSSAPEKLKNKNPHDVLYSEAVLRAIMNHVFIKNDHPSSYDNDDGILSNVITKTRRKRDLYNFPDFATLELNSRLEEGGFPPSLILNEMKDMKIVKVIKTNDKVKSSEFLLRNLTHFTTYHIGVQACREKVPSDTNETILCSPMVIDRIQTQANKTADIVDSASLHVNVTEGVLTLGWEEPSRPNGVVLAYTIRVKKEDKSPDKSNVHSTCITHHQFAEKDNGSVTFPDKLFPGNYSVRIKTHSLALDSGFSAEAYFYVEDLTTPISYWKYILMLLFLFVGVVLLSIVMFLRNCGIGERKIVSANPDYMQNVDIAEEWEVPREKLKILDDELGQGSFGKVYKGILSDFIAGKNSVKCAVKTVSDEATGEDRAMFLKEASLMTQLNCYHVVRLLGVISKTQPTCVVMELMGNGDLKNFLRSRRPESPSNNGNPPPSLSQILRMCCEIADGMCYIHGQSLVHRDLAARNCMVSEEMVVKVGDFGMTKDVVETDYYRKQSRGLLPVRWMAPESLLDGLFTSQSDVWSFGVVIWEMATLAAQPYQGLGNNQVLRYVQDGGIMDRPENCPEILYSLMRNCWIYESKRRPTFADILDWLTPQLADKDFSTVSFYHSTSGTKYRKSLANKPLCEDHIPPTQSRLNITFGSIMDHEDSDTEDTDRNLLSTHPLIDNPCSNGSQLRTGSNDDRDLSYTHENDLPLAKLSSSSNHNNNHNHLNNSKDIRTTSSLTEPLLDSSNSDKKWRFKPGEDSVFVQNNPSGNEPDENSRTKYPFMSLSSPLKYSTGDKGVGVTDDQNLSPPIGDDFLPRALIVDKMEEADQKSIGKNSGKNFDQSLWMRADEKPSLLNGGALSVEMISTPNNANSCQLISSGQNDSNRGNSGGNGCLNLQNSLHNFHETSESK